MYHYFRILLFYLFGVTIMMYHSCSCWKLPQIGRRVNTCKYQFQTQLNRTNCCIHLAVYVWSMGQCLLVQRDAGASLQRMNLVYSNLILLCLLKMAYLCLSLHVNTKSHIQTLFFSKSHWHTPQRTVWMMLRIRGIIPKNCFKFGLEFIVNNIQHYTTTVILILCSNLTAILYI